jgi:REP element-mobilizing transposase RayT
LAVFQCAKGAKSNSPGHRPGYEQTEFAACCNGSRGARTARLSKAAIPVLQKPQSPSSLLTHRVFSTKNREAMLTGEVATETHAYTVGVLNGIGCPSIQVGGVSDHVHLFFRLSRTRTIADVVETLKTSSSKWIKTKGSPFSSFHWQSGYGAFSVSQSDVDAVVGYIRDQPEHHKRVSFQEEYRRILDRYQISYDERYVWD